MAPLPPHLPTAVLSLLGGGASGEPTYFVVVIFALAIGLRVLRARNRGRRRGQWGGGPTGGRPGNTGGGGGSAGDAPVQWDIRKPAQGPTQQSDGAVSEESNPPSDL